MQKTKKVPQRKCIACQERDSKKGLIRIVKNKEGQIFLDPIGKANGRGAYICKDAECLKKAIKSKAPPGRNPAPAGAGALPRSRPAPPPDKRGS